MFSAAKRFLKHIIFLICSVLFIIFFTDKDVLNLMRNPWLYYGSFFLIFCMLLILAYVLGVPSFDELKKHLDRRLTGDETIGYDENGEQVEEQ